MQKFSILLTLSTIQRFCRNSLFCQPNQPSKGSALYLLNCPEALISASTTVSRTWFLPSQLPKRPWSLPPQLSTGIDFYHLNHPKALLFTFSPIWRPSSVHPQLSGDQDLLAASSWLLMGPDAVFHLNCQEVQIYITSNVQKSTLMVLTIVICQYFIIHFQ